MLVMKMTLCRWSVTNLTSANVCGQWHMSFWLVNTNESTNSRWTEALPYSWSRLTAEDNQERKSRDADISKRARMLYKRHKIWQVNPWWYHSHYNYYPTLDEKLSKTASLYSYQSISHGRFHLCPSVQDPHGIDGCRNTSLMDQTEPICGV